MSLKEEKRDGFYLLVSGERRRDKRKEVGNSSLQVSLQDPAKQRRDPRKQTVSKIHGTVWAVIDASCEILDLSRSGVRVVTRVNLPKGEEVGLHLLIPETKEDFSRQIPIFPICQVVWSKSAGMEFQPRYLLGLKILHLTEKQATVWQNFVDGLPELSPESH